MLLTVTLVVLGAVLLALTLSDRAVKRLPLTPSLLYLVVGWVAGALLGAPAPESIEAHAGQLEVITELVVLLSLFAVGLRLKLPPRLRLWRVALWMAGPGMVVACALGAVAAHWMLTLPWGAALLLGAIMAPTDPVLASEVQIRADGDRDAVRLSLTAEGGLNDGTAWPAVMLALALMGLHPGAVDGVQWWWSNLLLPVGGGALLGVALGTLLGHTLRWRLRRDDTLARDELLYVGAVVLAYGLARAAHTSAFVAVFALGVTLLHPLRGHSLAGSQMLGTRMQDFGARCERLVEAAMVMAVGVALHSVQFSWAALAFGLVLALLVRPLSVLLVIRRSMMTNNQRRLVAWFGIRGVGSLYYLMYVLGKGITGSVASELIAATLVAIAVSIVMHGVSSTPLMAKYQSRKAAAKKAGQPPGDAGDPAPASAAPV